MTITWWNFTRALESLKSLYFDWFFLFKYITFDLTKYGRFIFYDTEELCKVWRKTNLWFGKWHEKFGKFSSEHCKVWKLELLWNPFIQSWKCMSLKVTEDLCVMTMKNNAKCLGVFDFSLKSWHEEFRKFGPQHSKLSKTYTLMGSLSPKYVIFELRKYRGVMF